MESNRKSFQKLNSVIFLGRKKGAIEALNILIKQNINVKLIWTSQSESSSEQLIDVAKKNKIPIIYDHRLIYKYIEKGSPLLKDLDLVISYLFPYKIKDSLINLASIGGINFHPAPLPEYKGRAGYNMAILEEKKSYGVSAHFIDSEIDHGPIIKVLRFPIRNEETALSLEKKAQEKLIFLFKEVIGNLRAGNIIRTAPNSGGMFLTSQQLEDLKRVDFKKDDAKLIERKIRAFFFPPYSGANIEVNGKQYTLVDKKMLDFLKSFYE